MDRYTEDIVQAPDSEPVCWCSGVTKGQILTAMQSEGAKTLGDVKRLTGACQAGRCKELNPRGR